MRLTELNPNWCDAGGDGVFTRDENGELQPAPRRGGVGLMYDCPCGCGQRRFVPFENPVDGGPAHGSEGRPHWKRTGEDFETLTLTPSIKHVPIDEGDCDWHGFITDGGVRTV